MDSSVTNYDKRDKVGMKILIDLTSLSYHLSGIERYALCVTQEMLRQDKNNKYILVFRNEVFPELR